jgi:23S rRNA pseudouridine1911/1915/1917 synthase
MPSMTAKNPASGDSAGETLTGTLASAGRLDKALAEASGLSRERIKALIAEGMVTLAGASIPSPSAKAQGGEAFSIHLPPPADAQASPQDIPVTIAYEDEHLIVVDKPAGLVVHPAAGNPDGTLVNALLHHCRGQLSGIGGVARPGIVHRIDKDTSGLLVVAKSDAAHEGLARQFADHSIERLYQAIVNGHPQPASGTIDARIGRSDANRKKMAVLAKDSSRGKHAVTHYEVTRKLAGCALVACRLQTGRTHQVRVHLASIGHALLGDPLYGRSNAQVRPVLQELRFHRQALHAALLGFIHPVSGEHLSFSSVVPSDMRELIDRTAYSNR